MTHSIFLSASIPLQDRDSQYFETADIVAIKESIVALVSAICPTKNLVFGGQPAITPLVSEVAGQYKKSCVTVYQSEFFKNVLPPELSTLTEIIFVPSVENDLEQSLDRMRQAMLGSTDFDAAVFIGGMEGVEKEYLLFRQLHNDKPTYPIASTGAAALRLYEQNHMDQPDLLKDLQYLTLFRRLLGT